MSKSRFDKGSTIGNGRWDEDEHPRGKDGRFTRGAGSEYTTDKKSFTKDKDGNRVRVGDKIRIYDGSTATVKELRDGDVVAKDDETGEEWNWFSSEFRVLGK